MPRERTLTDEQRIEAKKEIQKDPNRIQVKFHTTTTFLKKFDKFAKRYQSRTACILDLIKTHPDFLKENPNTKQIKNQLYGN